MLTLIAPALLCLSPTPQDRPKTTTELVPLEPLCWHQQQYLHPPWGSLLRYDPDGGPSMLQDANEFPSIDTDFLVEELDQNESGAVDSGRLFLQPISGSLLIVGEQDTVRRTRQRIDEMTNLIARPLRVEFAIWDATDRSAPPTAMSPDDFARFAANHSPIWQAIGTGRSAHLIGLEHLGWTRYVRGIEVEVAQQQTMSRPATDRYGEGGHAVVRAYSLIDSDDFAVHAQFAVAQERGVLRTLQTGMPGGPDIELPRLESYFGAFSGRIPNGGALAATMRGDAGTGGQLIVTLRVIARTPPVSLSDKSVALLPCGALTSSSLGRRVALPGLDADNGFRPAGDSERFGYLPPDELESLANGVIEAADESGDGRVATVGAYIYVRSTPAAITQVAAMLRGLQERIVRNVSVQHTALLRPAQADDANDDSRRLLHELSLPTLPGRELVVARMLETNVISDCNIYIAQEAGILHPVTAALQSGIWFRARALPQVTGLHAEVQLTSMSAPTPQMRSIMPGGGVLMPAEVDLARVDHEGLLEQTQAIEHGDGPRVSIDGRSFRSTMSTTLRQ